MEFEQALSEAFDGTHDHFASSTVETLRGLFDLGREQGRIERVRVVAKVEQFEDLRVGDVFSNRWLKRYGQKRQVTAIKIPGHMIYTRLLGKNGEVLFDPSPVARSYFELHSPYWFHAI